MKIVTIRVQKTFIHGLCQRAGHMLVQSRNKTMMKQLLVGGVSALAVISGSEAAESNQINPYSPHAQIDFPTNVYWGDSHLHTGLSLDAGLFGNTVGPKDAWKFAKGEQVISSTGLPVKLARPLDWMVLADHTDMMGFATGIQTGAEAVVSNPRGKKWHEGFKEGGAAAGAAAFDLIMSFSQMTLPEELVSAYSPGSDVFKNVWHTIVDSADEANEPGRFTAFIGFEWTSVPKGINLHRNVMLRDGGDKAKQVVPPTTQAPTGSTHPDSLYKWLEDYERKTGGQAVAFAHNGNLSNGWMFPTEKSYHGDNVDKEYIAKRAKWEPHYEITQMKGDGEAHPYLSPDDPFADYETWDLGNLDISQLKKPEMLKGEYAREALKQGLALEEKYGINPYKFGFGGATDSHTSLVTADEDNFFSKTAHVEPKATRVNRPFLKMKNGKIAGHQIAASGYTGVWAKENTREALYDAFVRKETYGTTGPRIRLRFFGGWDYSQDDLRTRYPEENGYKKGVPMGGDLPSREGAKAPTFMVSALRDPMGANLDRVQIVKGWLDSDGSLKEKVYNVAWSDNRELDAQGALPAVGNTVHLETASWTNTIGASELITVWTDPDFDKNERAFYYTRVLEIPTPRWVVYDNVRLGAKLPEGIELIGQERAYSSPIWYTPPKG